MYTGSKETSPLRTSYGQYTKDATGVSPSIGLNGQRYGEPQPTGGPSGYIAGSSDREMQDSSHRDSNMLARIDVLEKEQKTLQALVRKSEKAILDANKKAQEEENKIFSLFIGVIIEKQIRIDMNDINKHEESQEFMNNSKHSMGNTALNNNNTGDLVQDDMNSLLMDHLTNVIAENENDLPPTLLALNRRLLIRANP